MRDKPSIPDPNSPLFGKFVKRTLERMMGRAGEAAVQKTVMAFGGETMYQVVRASISTRIDISGTVIPEDNTIPQSTEGTQVLTVTIKPRNKKHRLRIEFCAPTGNGINGDTAVAALFKNSETSAIAVGVALINGGRMNNLMLLHDMEAGTEEEIAFKVRAGPVSAGTTMAVNGSGANSRFGGVCTTWLIVTEYEVPEYAELKDDIRDLTNTVNALIAQVGDT